MVKHTQTIRGQKPTNCLNEFDHFLGLALKGLKGIIGQKYIIGLLHLSWRSKKYVTGYHLALSPTRPCNVIPINFVDCSQQLHVQS